MFSFLKRYTLLDAELLKGFADCHSHILPAVDDGAKGEKESLKILSWYEEMGVRKVIFTPHIMERYPLNNYSYLTQEFAKFKSLYTGNIDLHLGAEYMIDSQFEKHLSEGNMLTIKDNYLLVELSFISPPVQLHKRLQAIISMGYFVVLAHPERYLFFEEREYRELKEMGVLFQLNMLSLLGWYGESVKQQALMLLNLSMYDTIGSDIHSLRGHKHLMSSVKLPHKNISKIEPLCSWIK